MGSADKFFERLEKNSKELVTWKGELVRNILIKSPIFVIYRLNYLNYLNYF
jgi:hypothetical protein